MAKQEIGDKPCKSERCSNNAIVGEKYCKVVPQAGDSGRQRKVRHLRHARCENAIAAWSGDRWAQMPVQAHHRHAWHRH